MARIGAFPGCSPADDEFGRPESCLYGCCEHLHSLLLCEEIDGVKTLKSESAEMIIRRRCQLIEKVRTEAINRRRESALPSKVQIAASVRICSAGRKSTPQTPRPFLVIIHIGVEIAPTSVIFFRAFRHTDSLVHNACRNVR